MPTIGGVFECAGHLAEEPAADLDELGPGCRKRHPREKRESQHRGDGDGPAELEFQYDLLMRCSPRRRPAKRHQASLRATWARLYCINLTSRLRIRQNIDGAAGANMPVKSVAIGRPHFAVRKETDVADSGRPARRRPRRERALSRQQPGPCGDPATTSRLADRSEGPGIPAFPSGASSGYGRRPARLFLARLDRPCAGPTGCRRAV